MPTCFLPKPVACPSINVVETIIEKGKDLLHVTNYSTATPETYEAMCVITEAYADGKNIVCRQTNNLISKGSEKELAEILCRYQLSGIVVSSALHGCIIAVAMGLKVIAVSGDWKIDAFMEAVGLKDWVLNYNEPHLLPQLLADIENQTATTTYLSSIKLANKEIAADILDVLSLIKE